MKPEPPSASATLYASTAAATGTTWSHGVVDEAMRPPEHDDRRGDRPGDEPADDAVADLLDDEPEGRHVAHVTGVRLRDREHDEEQRHADAVVEAALDVQPLPDA